ncbi:MAG: DUF4180 domain-containing protein [Clostridiales bacterium]|nr:DUF4180 domain-containing protein [Clostridiales bacterium]
MRIFTRNGTSVAVIDSARKLTDPQDFLDLMAEAWVHGQCTGMVIDKASLGDGFFDLKNGLAGEILQKFSNYRMKLAIVGDFSGYRSKSLRDFIGECNRGSLIFFEDNEEAALNALMPGDR